MWDDRFIMIFLLGILWPFVYTKKRKLGNEIIQNEVEELLQKYHSN